MATAISATPTPAGATPSKLSVTSSMIDKLDSSARDAQRKFTELMFEIANLRAKYEDVERRLAASPSRAEYEALQREKDALAAKAEELQRIVDEAKQVVNGDVKVGEILAILQGLNIQLDEASGFVKKGLGTVS